MWDQRRLKQSVVQGYAGLLQYARPVYNLVARLRRRPPLPNPAEALRSAYLFCFYVKDDEEEVATELLRTMRALASARGLSYLLAGFDTRDPLLAIAARAPHVRYTSRLYLAHWPDLQPEAESFFDRCSARSDNTSAGRPVHVEAATL